MVDFPCTKGEQDGDLQSPSCNPNNISGNRKTILKKVLRNIHSRGASRTLYRLFPLGLQIKENYCVFQ